MSTREELRSYTTHSSNFTATAFTFTLENNATTTAYFAIEGARYLMVKLMFIRMFLILLH